MSEQARASNGEWASGGNQGEQGQRERKRIAVTAHVQKSVGTSTGRHLLGNLAKAALGVAAGAAGTFIGSALRSQRRGGRR